jgi:hypothetical protein
MAVVVEEAAPCAKAMAFVLCAHMARTEAGAMPGKKGGRKVGDEVKVRVLFPPVSKCRFVTRRVLF